MPCIGCQLTRQRRLTGRTWSGVWLRGARRGIVLCSRFILPLQTLSRESVHRGQPGLKMQARPVWQEASDAESDSSESRLAMVDALEEMARAEEARRSGFEDGDEDDDDTDDDEEDEDYVDADYLVEDNDEDEDEDDFDVEDMEQVVGDIEIQEADEDDEEEDSDDSDAEEESNHGNIRTTTDLNALVQAVISGQASQNAQDDGEEDTPQSRTIRALQGIGIAGLRQLLAHGRFRLTGGDDDDDDDDDDEDGAGGNGTSNWYGASRSSGMTGFWDPVKEPLQAGQELLLSGQFGKTPKRPLGSPPSAFEHSVNVVDRVNSRRTKRTRITKDEMSDLLPNSSGAEVARYPARVYCGQYSEDSSFFYTCTQDFRVQMYDTTAANSKRTLRMDAGMSRRRAMYYTSFGTTQYTSLKPIKTIQGRMGNWTITDANLSPDNQWMIYSSITPTVHLVSTKAESQGGSDYSDRQVPLEFEDDSQSGGIWSIRFSGDSREIVAGAHYGNIYVYDIEARRRVLRVDGHQDDVNGVTFADSASSNVLISGSDDSYVKVWDRRSLSGGKPAGVLPGHTEGITYVAPKGDGRYCISNGKDQSLKLWDLRNMKSSADAEQGAYRRDYGLRNWDYRNMYYRKPRFQSHPEDCSVMTFRGHAVLKTLIRCHFSPTVTTGQKYVYSGSADGRIHIWSLDGRVVQVLDRSHAQSIFLDGESAVDPSAPENRCTARAGGTDPGVEADMRSYNLGRNTGGGVSSRRTPVTVRDVSWHSSEASLMSTAWDGPDSQRGSIAKHEWKGYGKGISLEDAIAKSEAEAAELGS
ncbi:unnamed protein product [Parajaminaea phylloscopi]